MGKYQWYWDDSRKLESNLQGAVGVFLEAMSDVVTELSNVDNRLHELVNAPNSVAASLGSLSCVVGDFTNAVGVNANLAELKGSIEALTKVVNEAVERSMRNETLDLLREANAAQQHAINELKQEERKSKYEELQLAFDHAKAQLDAQKT